MEVICLKSKFMKGAMRQNSYILKGENSAIIIDAGAELDEVIETLGDLKLEAVLLTHLHFDHFWNIEEYVKRFDCDIYICEGAQDKFCDSYKNGAFLVGLNNKATVPNENLKFYQNHLSVAGFDIDVYFTPGHSADCVCLKIGDMLFSGDTIFADGVGRTDLFDSDKNELLKSLNIIKTIDFKYLCPGHYECASKDAAENIIAYFV